MLILYRISVTAIDNQIGKLKKLEILQITDHYCVSLPWESFGKLKNLKLFDMGEGYNYDEAVSEDVCNWSQLRYFRMTGTQITSLPDCVSKWQQLRRVELNAVSLTSLPSQFFLLPQLVIFVCEFHKITYDGLAYVFKSFNLCCTYSIRIRIHIVFFLVFFSFCLVVCCLQL